MIALSMNCTALLAFWSPGHWEMLLLAVVALLLYGGDLPKVARSWGKTLSEFRRSLSGIQSEINEVIYDQPERLEYRDDSYSDDAYDITEAETTEVETTEAETDEVETDGDKADDEENGAQAESSSETGDEQLGDEKSGDQAESASDASPEKQSPSD